MSARNPDVVLAPLAEVDIEDILVYTRRQWGLEQEETYAAAIRNALLAIAAHPDIGKPRDDLRPGLRAFFVERQHFILYRVESDVIRVLRIVHSCTNPATWLR